MPINIRKGTRFIFHIPVHFLYIYVCGQHVVLKCSLMSVKNFIFNNLQQLTEMHLNNYTQSYRLSEGVYILS